VLWQIYCLHLLWLLLLAGMMSATPSSKCKKSFAADTRMTGCVISVMEVNDVYDY
jgi:hypothetical protein